MFLAEMYQNLAYLLRDVPPVTKRATLKERIGAGTVSKRRRKQIERHFDSLVDYVFAPPATAFSVVLCAGRSLGNRLTSDAR